MLGEAVGAESRPDRRREGLAESAGCVFAEFPGVSAVQGDLPRNRSHVSSVVSRAAAVGLVSGGVVARQLAPVASDLLTAEHYLSIDLGAGSGRVVLGRFDGERLALDEVHRFPNPGIEILGRLHWDALFLFREMLLGMRTAAASRPVSVGVDTWGVDFALLDRDGELVGNPRHYRDAGTRGKMREAFDVVSRERIFESTGLQFMEINSLYQLFAMTGTARLDAAASFLMMPDLFHYWFTGERACEFTDTTTSQCYDPRKSRWAYEVLEGLGLPTHLFGEVVAPGTVIGRLRPSVAEECGATGMRVVAPGTHDTASAVAAVPAQGDDWAFLSSGTWSLLGVETDRPHVSPDVLDSNFTNEGGVCGRNRLLKNICGLWLLEECRREWSRRGVETDYERLIHRASQSAAFRSLVHVDDPEFLAPGDMPARIENACRRSGQRVPGSPGQFARAIFESLALRYRSVLADLARITGRRPAVLHVVGGGSRNALLCQYAADACGIPVVAGPVEATSAGNVLMQSIASGRIGDLAQARSVVRDSFQMDRYEPEPATAAAWEEAAGRLAETLEH